MSAVFAESVKLNYFLGSVSTVLTILFSGQSYSSVLSFAHREAAKAAADSTKWTLQAKVRYPEFNSKSPPNQPSPLSLSHTLSHYIPVQAKSEVTSGTNVFMKKIHVPKQFLSCVDGARLPTPRGFEVLFYLSVRSKKSRTHLDRALIDP